MGIENHNAIIATTWNSEEVERIKAFVKTLGPDSQSLFLFGPETINAKTTVVMLPDGSKEGWAKSDAGDALRNDFIIEIERANYEDGSSPWEWIEVGYGEYGKKVIRGNCKNRYGEEEYAISV